MAVSTISARARCFWIYFSSPEAKPVFSTGVTCSLSGLPGGAIKASPEHNTIRSLDPTRTQRDAVQQNAARRDAKRLEASGKQRPHTVAISIAVELLGVSNGQVDAGATKTVTITATVGNKERRARQTSSSEPSQSSIPGLVAPCFPQHTVCNSCCNYPTGDQLQRLPEPPFFWEHP